MSYLNPPRVHFAGKFEAAVSTVNNDPTHFDNAQFKPEYQKLQDASALNGWFNPRGDAAFRLIGCQITGAYGPDGRPVGADPVFGCFVADSDRLAPAKLVDLDPEQQLVSTIFGLEVRICDAHGANLVRGTHQPAPFTDIWDRAAGPGSDANAGSMYQSVLTDLEWGDVSHSPFLTALRAAAADGLLSIKFNVDGFNMDFGGPDFMRGRIVGTIGPASAAEPRHFVAARQFMATANPQGNFFLPNGGINFCTALVDDSGGQVLVDLGNALATVDPGGDIVPRQSLGRLALAYLDPAQPAPVVLGQIPYWHAGWYQSTAGVVTVPLTPAQLDAIQELPLALVRGTGTPLSWKPAAQEPASGLHVRADEFVFRVDDGETATARLFATRFGKPAAGAQITVVRDEGGMQTGPGAPDVGVPDGGVAFDAHVQAGATGIAELHITGGDTQRNRVYIDGQLYGLRPSIDGAPASDPANPWDFVSVLVFDGFQPDEPLAWYGTPDGSLQPIMQQYANLYPVMYTFLDLADYEDVCRNRDMLLLAFRLAEQDPNSMPVTRDLSSAKRAAVLSWLEAIGADGKPVLGKQPPAPVEERAVAAPEPVEPSADFADLARKGGKAAALARRNRPVYEPPPGAPA